MALSDSSRRRAASSRSDSWFRRTKIVAELAARPDRAAIRVRNPVSPSGGTLVWTSSTSSSARMMASASVAMSRTASDVAPGGGETLTTRIFSEPELMKAVGRSGTRKSEPTNRASAPTTVTSDVNRLRRTARIVGS